MSKTKGGGSTRNGRDSNAQRLGVKAFGGTEVPAGAIIVRQRGTKVHPGQNVGRGGDDTLFALPTGTVRFTEPQGPQAGRRRRRLTAGTAPANRQHRARHRLDVVPPSDPSVDGAPGGAAPGRALPFEGCVNFRDLGGYRTRDGRSVRWRHLFRADGLNRLSEADRATLVDLEVATVIDLRTVDEADQRGRFPVEQVPVRYLDLPLTDVLPSAEELPSWREASYVASRYVAMVTDGGPGPHPRHRGPGRGRDRCPPSSTAAPARTAPACSPPSSWPSSGCPTRPSWTTTCSARRPWSACSTG